MHISQVTHRYNDHWLSGHWTIKDDPPRVLNVFKDISGFISVGPYMIIVSTKVWNSSSQATDRIEVIQKLDALEAQCVIYEMLEKYK